LPTLTIEEFEAELARGDLSPVYLLLGPEAFLVRRALASLKEKAMPQDALAFNFIECSAKDSTPARIVHEANTFPLMSSRRVVIVTDLEKLAEGGQETLAAYLVSPQKKTVLVLVAEDIDRRTSFYKRILEHASIVECRKLEGVALRRRAEQTFSQQGCRISSSALDLLVDLAGGDLSSMMGEIEKLILYAGTEKTIRDATVELLVEGSRQHGIFELTTAMGQKDRKAALRLLGNLLESGEAPLYILAMMAWHFRRIIIAQEMLAEGRAPGEIGKALKVWGNQLPEFMKGIRSTDPRTMRQMLPRLARMDRAFKSTGADERLLLEELICSL
jgi:DNA polymerase III subunit delta